MHNNLKESSIFIENELFKKINKEKGLNSLLDFFVSKISSDYFSFQESLLNIVNKKTSFSIENHEITFNKMLAVRTNHLRNEKYLSLKFDSMPNKNKHGITWHGMFHRESEYENTTLIINPLSYIDIKVLSHKCDFLVNRDIEKIQIYFFDHLSELNDSFNLQINNSSQFLIPLEKVLNILEKSNMTTFKLFNENMLYNNSEIYSILNENKELISLGLDFDSTPQIELMKKYFSLDKKVLELK